MNLFPPTFPGIAYQDATVIQTATTTDRYGDGATTEVRRPLPRCLFKPEQSVELVTINQPGVSTAATIYCPLPDFTLDADDRIELAGQLWEIIGAPLAWGQVGLEIPVRRWGNA